MYCSVFRGHVSSWNTIYVSQHTVLAFPCNIGRVNVLCAYTCYVFYNVCIPCFFGQCACVYMLWIVCVKTQKKRESQSPCSESNFEHNAVCSFSTSKSMLFVHKRKYSRVLLLSPIPFRWSRRYCERSCLCIVLYIMCLLLGGRHMVEWTLNPAPYIHSSSRCWSVVLILSTPWCSYVVTHAQEPRRVMIEILFYGQI